MVTRFEALEVLAIQLEKLSTLEARLQESGKNNELLGLLQTLNIADLSSTLYAQVEYLPISDDDQDVQKYRKKMQDYVWDDQYREKLKTNTSAGESRVHLNTYGGKNPEISIKVTVKPGEIVKSLSMLEDFVRGDQVTKYIQDRDLLRQVNRNILQNLYHAMGAYREFTKFMIDWKGVKESSKNLDSTLWGPAVYLGRYLKFVADHNPELLDKAITAVPYN